MNATLRIYKFRNLDNTVSNFFSQLHNNDFRDYIDTVQIIDVPKLSEQFNKYYDLQETQVSNYKILLSLLDKGTPERSFYGKSMKDFIFDSVSLNNNFGVRLTLNGEQYCGMIDLPSIEKDVKEETLQFMFLGMEAELKKLLETVAIEGIAEGSKPTFENWFNFNGEAENISFQNDLGVSTKAGFPVKVSDPIFNSIVPFITGGKWEIFKQIIIGLGATYKIEYTGEYRYYQPTGNILVLNPLFRMRIFFRTDATTRSKDLLITEQVEKISNDYANEFVFVPSVHMTFTRTEGETYWFDDAIFGLLIWNGGYRIVNWRSQTDDVFTYEYISGEFAVSNSQDFFAVGYPPTPERTLSKKVLAQASINLYNSYRLFPIRTGVSSETHTTLLRCLVKDYHKVGAPQPHLYYDEGHMLILQNVVYPAYKILVKGLTKQIDCTVVYDSENMVRTGQVDRSTGYYVNRVSEIDTEHEEAKVELLQLS